MMAGSAHARCPTAVGGGQSGKNVVSTKLAVEAIIAKTAPKVDFWARYGGFARYLASEEEGDGRGGRFFERTAT
jgi:hypothetical protein